MNFKSCAGIPMHEKKQGAFHQTLLIMRLTGLLIIIFCFNVTASVLAQQINLNLKEQPIEKVFDEISKQSGYQFVYNDRLLEHTNNVSLTLKNADLQTALDECFKNQPVTYKIVGKSIVVKLKPKTQPKTPSQIMPDDKTIRGQVTDTTGTPLPGAVIKIKGTNIATVAKSDGSYEIKDVPANAILVITMIGYQTEEIPVSDVADSYLKISLSISVSSLNQVSIVSTGYQELPRERATGSFDQIDNALLNRSVSTDVISRLKGVTSGLIFDNTANNGLGIAIRGRSTLASNTQPLIILDNFPYEGDINNINPNDIESITVLKDAAASSIWGALAGNGVIVITTKKGKFNQPLSIDFNSNLTLQKKPNLFYAGNQFLSSPDYIGVEQMLFSNGFYDSKINDVDTYPAISPAVEILNAQRNGIITADQAKQQLAALGNHDVRNDLNKYIYKTAVLQQYSLNLHGGSSNMNYLFSVGEDNNKNIQSQIGDKYNRLTLNSNVTYRPIKNLELYTNITYSNSNTTNNSNASYLVYPGDLYPYANFADAAGNPLPINIFHNNALINSSPGKGLLNWSYSPLEELKNADNTSNLSDIRINAGLKYTLIKGLSAEVRYQYEKAITNGRNYFNENSYYTRNLINQFSVVNGDGTITRNVPLGGIIDFSNNTVISNYLRGQLNYNSKWGKSEINAIAGAEVRQIEGNGNTSRIYGYDEENGTNQPVDYLDYFIRSIADLHSLLHYPAPAHPMISLIEHPAHSAISSEKGVIYRIGLYSIACKRVIGKIRYGRGHYDFSNGTLMFTAPGQVVPGGTDMTIEDGWTLLFHPELLHGTGLSRGMHKYTFFNYEVDEALHISEDEQSILKDCVLKIQKEYRQNIDRHTQGLLVSNIELLLNYCPRFYDRQFFTRAKPHSDVIQRFERLLKAYFSDPTLVEKGLPGVAYFASEMNLSPNYLSDVQQKFTGKNTLEHIHLEIVSQAQLLLLSTSATISEVTYLLGFEHPSHFTKIFKAKTGASPSAFRNHL